MILLLSLSFSVGLAVKRTILLIWTFTVYVSAVYGMGFDINKPLQESVLRCTPLLAEGKRLHFGIE